MALDLKIKKKLQGFALDCSFNASHEIIGILGASGSGKSMLLRSIAGLVKPDTGRIAMNGRTLFDSEGKIDLSPKERRVGFLFQNFALFPHMTIFDNIGFGLGKMTRKDKSDKVMDLIGRFHLSGMENRYPAQISGGQQQRAALARALSVEPEILLLDEPFSALDEHLKIQMMKEMSETLAGYPGTVLFVTHNMQEVYRLANRIIVLNNGSMEAFGSKEDVFMHPPTLDTARITGCKNLAAAHRLSDYKCYVPEWGAELSMENAMALAKGYIGIRANHIRQATGSEPCNRFEAYIADHSEAPFRISLFLKIGGPPAGKEDYHIQWEISRDEWNRVCGMAQPLELYLDPKRVFFMP